jgi:hypothetical protein
MAQTGFTPIQIYSSSTAAAAPAVGNLTNSTLGSELAINITDGKLFYKDNANAVQVIGWKTVPTTAGGTGLTSYTAGDLVYYASGTAFTKLAIGASGRYLASSGTAPQWNAPAALTKADDTNVTLTLGGSASTALLNAASLTLGWTGTLAVARGGTGAGTASITAFNNITGYTASGATGTTSTNLVFSTSPTLTTPKATTTIGVGNATPSASGAGITFPATVSASTDPNTLDDYEEGTYTPTVTGLTFGNAVISGGGFNYVRVGRICTISATFQWGSTSTSTGDWGFTVPFTMQDSGGGAAYALDSGTAVYALSVVGSATNYGDSIRIGDGTGAGFLGGTSPFTWAAGDIFSIGFTYTTT